MKIPPDMEKVFRLHTNKAPRFDNKNVSESPLSEDELALRFSEQHQDDLRYVAARSSWFKWDGARWRREETRLAFDLVRKSCREAAKEFGNGNPPKKTLTAATFAAVERIASADRRQAATHDEWDVDDLTFNMTDD